MFFETQASENVNRLKRVLIADKHFNPESIKRVIKSDEYNMLKNYADILPEDIFLDIDITNSGEYEITVKAHCKRLKIFGALPDEY